MSARGQIRVAPSHNLTGKLVLQPLEPATRYRYTITQNAAATAGEFVTAPAATVAIPVRFAWSGDLGSRGHCRKPGDVFPVFRALAQVPADFFLFVGDTIYADHECGESTRVPGYDFVARRLADFWAKHLYNRQDPAGQAYFRSTSVYAIWDDHEVRNDFSGPTEPLTETGRRAFIDYFPIRPPREEPGRLYRSFRWGSLLEVFILDTRQYRSPNADPDGPGKTMLGAAQRRWLIDAVSSSTAVWKVVVSSVPLSVPTGSHGPRLLEQRQRAGRSRDALDRLRGRARLHPARPAAARGPEPRGPRRRRALRAADPSPPDDRLVLPRVHRGTALGDPGPAAPARPGPQPALAVEPGRHRDLRGHRDRHRRPHRARRRRRRARALRPDHRSGVGAERRWRERREGVRRAG